MTGAICAAAAVLLILSGAAKLRAPKPTVAMLEALQRKPLLRRDQLAKVSAAIGVTEIIVGLVVIAHGGRVAAGFLAACYLIFAVVAVVLRNRKHAVSCGCFGKSDAPVSATHIVIDVVAAGVAALGVVQPFGALGGYAAQPVAIALVGLAQVAVLAAVAYFAMTVLPAVMVVNRQVRSRT